MSTRFKTRTRDGARRRAMVAIYVALSLVMLMGMAGLAVDVSFLYQNRAKAQRAADSAALAGAIKLAGGGFAEDAAGLAAAKAAADVNARQAAAANGYDTATTGVSVTSTYRGTGMADNWYQVSVSRPEPLYFIPILIPGLRNRQVGAQATALYQIPVDIPASDAVEGGGAYGSSDQVMNLSTFGPYALHSYGDMYSPIYQDSISKNYISGGVAGQTNPYNVGFDGYNFNVSVPPGYQSAYSTSQVSVEIFDPDCHNTGGTDALRNVRVDEIRDPAYGQGPRGIKETTTQYSLYYTNGTPRTDDDILISQQTYGDDATTDMKWVSPSGFQFDANDSRWAGHASDPNAFRLNVKSIDGSSENGFLLRAGPPHAASMTEAAWGAAYSTVKVPFTAAGRIPINFNQSGSVTINLGTVPANSTKITIGLFDTDVGAQSVSYTDGTITVSGRPLTANGEYKEHVIDLPANYAGGNWKAVYNAGLQDTSSWSMSYSGPAIPGNNSPGLVKLIR